MCTWKTAWSQAQGRFEEEAFGGVLHLPTQSQVIGRSSWDWQTTRLFVFLAHRVAENLSGEKDVYTRPECAVLSSSPGHLISNTMHTLGGRHQNAPVDSANKGYRRIILLTLDTDILVLAVSTVVSLEDTEIWVAFGTGKHLRYIPAHGIAKELGYEKALSLPLFHAFTGCDTVSSFAGREKRLHLTYGSLSMRSHLYSVPWWRTHRSSMTTACLCWRHLLYFCMSELAQKLPWSWPGSTYSPPKADLWKTYHHQEQPSPAHKTSSIPGWICVGAGNRPLSIYSLSRNIRLAEECDARMQQFWTLLPEAVAWCSEQLKCGCKKGCRGLQMREGCSQMYITLSLQWELRPQW